MTARSDIMRAVKSVDTGPELAVRRLVHGLGYRYRLHGRGLPGKPDLVFSSRRKIIFVHGCFWHGHRCKRGARIPATNTDYWKTKIARNKQRDRLIKKALVRNGWSVLVIWECKAKNTEILAARLKRFLGRRSPNRPHAA